MDRDRSNQAESRRIIGRVGAESEASMTRRAVERVGDHMAGRDAAGDDWAERWGTRIGRWLGAALLVYVIWWLIDFPSGNG